MKKTTRFRELLYSGRLEFLMEAHNGLSGKIVEESGFMGIWASSLALSASMGMRDNNEVSWSQAVEFVEQISDATTIPILLDADTGYGNFNNVRLLVKKLEKHSVAAVCIEDKLFPKTNSFINSDKQQLISVEEFCGKIKAAKDTQNDQDFSVVARTEAFIVGQGLEEVLKRAEAYYNAGADAILVHSKISDPSEIISFIQEWRNTCPVIIAPTMYCNTPTHVFEEIGISIVIWANHMLRASITNMQSLAERVYQDRSISNVEQEIVPVKEIFRLQNADELEAAERKYLIPLKYNKDKSIHMNRLIPANVQDPGKKPNGQIHNSNANW